MKPIIQSWRSYFRSRRPTWFAGAFVAFSCAWIWVTDGLVRHFGLSAAEPSPWNAARRLVYVAITGGLIYKILRRLEDANNNLEQTITTRTAALTASEEELRTREEWLRRLLASLPDVSWTTSEDMRTVFVSPNVEEIFGFSAEEVCENTEKVFLGSIHPEDKQRVIDGFQALFTRGQRFDEEFRAQRKDGQWIWVHDRAVRTHSEEGVMFADGILSDITARKEAEAAREESDERYRLLFERNLAGIFRADLGGSLLECNPAFFRMLGYDSAAELVGRGPEAVLYDAAERSVVENMLAETGVINKVEFQLKRKDGTVIYGLSNIRVVPNSNGGPTVAEGTVIDVTDRKRMADALQKQLDLMQAITSTAPDGLFLLDAEGRLTFMNPAGERLCGYTMRELQGKNVHDLCHYKSRDGSPLPRSECAVARACASGHTLCGHEDVYFRKDGSMIEVSCSTAPLREGDRIVGYVQVVQDITARKLAEQQYKSLQDQFLHAQKMEAIGRLAGGIAHDFNNLLQVINGYSSLMADEVASNPPLAKRAWAIHEAGARAARLTQQLLDFSRKGPGDAQTLSLGHAVNQLMKMVRTIVGEDIDLTSNIHTNGACVRMSPGQLEQLIMNLVVNARDAMPKGGKLHIESKCVNLDDGMCKTFGFISPGAYVQVSVSDTGCGMDAATIRHVFEPFFTTKEPGKGTGLGLSTVYGIVTQTGGGIQIESTPGAGTTFHICLPVSAPSASSGKIQVRLALSRGTESILLVEDEADVRSLISGELVRLGYKVVEAGNGVEALRLAADAPGSIDLLISDVIMPKMGGQELTKKIREVCPTIKIVHMSGYNDGPLLVTDESGTGIPHLQKPFNFETLAATVRQVLDD